MLIGAVLLYQLWDFRTASIAFDDWWAFFGPSFAGDDYIAATLDAEHVDDLHMYYRSIAVVTGARRMATGTPEELHVPKRLHLLWSDDPDDTGDFARPTLRGSALEAWGPGRLTSSHYDPILPAGIISRWRDQGRVTDLAWNVATVRSDEDEDSFILFADEARVTIYVVPQGLASDAGEVD